MANHLVGVHWTVAAELHLAAPAGSGTTPFPLIQQDICCYTGRLFRATRDSLPVNWSLYLSLSADGVCSPCSLSNDDALKTC